MVWGRVGDTEEEQKFWRARGREDVRQHPPAATCELAIRPVQQDPSVWARKFLLECLDRRTSSIVPGKSLHGNVVQSVDSGISQATTTLNTRTPYPFFSPLYLFIQTEGNQQTSPCSRTREETFVAPNEAAVTIEVFPKESIVKVGDTVTVMCRAGEKLQYCRVTSPAGTFNLKPNIPVSNGYIYSGKGLETGECGFTIANVQEMNNGNHTCYLGFDNTGLESNTTMSVIVARPPTTSPELSVSLVGSRVSADFQEGQTIQAMCRVPDNRPPSNLTWFIGNEQVTDGLSPIRKEPENCGYADLCAVSQNLTHTLSWRDNGKELSCFVQHFAMDERANNQTKSQLNVLYKPRDVEISSEQFGFEIGKPGRISKQVQANPRPSFAWNVGGGEWIREGQVDSLTGRFRAGETINNGSGIWQASLEIDSVTAEDVERVYNLRASNIAGVTDYAVSISTMDAPQGQAPRLHNTSNNNYAPRTTISAESSAASHRLRPPPCSISPSINKKNMLERGGNCYSLPEDNRRF
uniref:Ig-like domain-containing protein n=1 Tax=Timema shepardi TaxID=629360 RepID=A0A7R9FYV4_TIMSH|nr:unnamed protein product [Timema shepardi]